jgi:hypothetical protein
MDKIKQKLGALLGKEDTTELVEEVLNNYCAENEDDVTENNHHKVATHAAALLVKESENQTKTVMRDKFPFAKVPAKWPHRYLHQAAKYDGPSKEKKCNSDFMASSSELIPMKSTHPHPKSVSKC